MKAWTANKVTLMGNIPPRDVLASGTPADVTRSVGEMLQATGRPLARDRILWRRHAARSAHRKYPGADLRRRKIQLLEIGRVFESVRVRSIIAGLAQRLPLWRNRHARKASGSVSHKESEMFVQQFFVKGLAHSSYLLGGTDFCAIVDPQRDVDIYIDAAKAQGMKITHVLETHLHADFISGHMDLADKTGAAICAPKAGNCRFEHVAMAEGDSLQIDNVRIAVLDVAGHTPEHIAFVVTDLERGEEPAAVFCGDTLFVGDVGRPDLFPGKAMELASKLYDNIHGKLLKLPDFCEVYPAHGAGSLCGRAMGAKRTSTIGYERRYNAALQIRDKDAFIASLTTDMPAVPDHFARCSAINGGGAGAPAHNSRPDPYGAGVFCRKVSKDRRRGA